MKKILCLVSAIVILSVPGNCFAKSKLTQIKTTVLTDISDETPEEVLQKVVDLAKSETENRSANTPTCNVPDPKPTQNNSSSSLKKIIKIQSSINN